MANFARTRWILGAAAGAAGMVAVAMPGAAIEDAEGREGQNSRPARSRFVRLYSRREASGDDLSCNVGRTWQKSKIVKGVREKNISWTFGDAQCTVSVKMKRAAIIDALTKPSYDFELEPHTVKCQVEREEGVSDISLKLAPKMSFKNGKVEKTWLNVSDIKAPTIIKGAIWTVSQLEDNIGLFHGEMVEEINEFIHEKCAKRHGG